jgi:predicted kinase
MTTDTGQTESGDRAIFLPRNTLVVLCGPAGSGKSTFAARNFTATEVVSSDECRALVSDDPANQGVSRHAFDLLYFIIEKRLLLGRLTVADATNLDRLHRKELRKIARYFDFNTAAFVFKVPLEVCLARNKARSRVVPEDALRRQYEMLEATLGTIRREGFNYVFLLDDESQSQVRVRVGRWVNRQPARPAPRRG